VAILQEYQEYMETAERSGKGGMMNCTEQALRSPTSGTPDQRGGLRRAAMTSLVPWLVITSAGVVLTNAA
jgi:hypothetical protein